MSIFNPDATWNMDDPLERMEGESKRSHAALHEYAVMGPGRSLRKLHESFNAREVSPTRHWWTISQWSRNFRWVARVERFDELNRAKAIAAFEAHWQEKVMGSTETIGRLSEQARASIADFITVKMVPAALVISPRRKGDGEGEDDEENIDLSEGFIQVAELNWEAIRENGHLVKAITNTRYGPRLELHDGQSALVQVGRYHKLFVDQAEVKSVSVQVSADDMDEARRKAQEYEKGLLNDRPAE